VRAIRLDDGAHGDGATTSPVPSAWARSPYLAKIVCRQGGFDERFDRSHWHGLYAMTKGEVHEVAPEFGCTVSRPACSRGAVRVHQQVAGLRWIWTLYATPKGAWEHIERTGRFNSFPRRGTNDRATKRPFRMCPVGGTVYYNDDFGEYRSVGGYHPHSGNDVSAPIGRPIRAPFDGLAVAHADDWFAGRYVHVVGARGYVNNVHLSRFGHLGYVKAGAIVGYVGETGDARGPHDHFEWHPWVKPSPLHESPQGFKRVDDAIDPFPFLNKVC
jgi:murein DD-endopeptidase MepM/ murein hydrolase activator NlpD